MSEPTIRVPLRALAHARAGDKGNTSNVAVIVYAPELYPLVRDQLTPERFAAHFQGRITGRVERFEVARLGVINYVAELVVDDQVMAKGLVKAIWSADTNLTTRIDPAVAHYTGQAPLADVIQRGLAAKSAGDERTATVLLGEAAKLAHDSGNEQTTRLLAKVVDVVDVEAGTVRLKQQVAKSDEMALDTRSTKTTRIRREP